MARRPTVELVGVAALGILAASLWGSEAAAVVFAILAVAFPALLMLAGAERRGSVRPAVWPIAVLAVVLELGLAGLLVFRGRVLDGPQLLGLPAAAAIQLYGFLVLPLAVVALGYAWAFGASCPTGADLERLRRLGRREEGPE